VLFLVHRFLSPWWRRRQVPPKRQFLQEPHGVTTQKTPFLNVYVFGSCIRGQNLSKTFSSIQEECFDTMECIQMDWKIKKRLSSVTYEEGARHPHMATNEDNMTMLMTWFCYRDQWLLMKCQIICKVVMVLRMETLTRDLGFIKTA
jgi:hypothetical protein